MKQPRYVTREQLDSRVRKLVRAGGISIAGGGVVSGGGGAVVVTAYEPLLGSPAEDGYLLSSSKVGARSWVSPYGLRMVPVVSVDLDYADATSYLNAAEPGRLYVFVVPAGATDAWAGKDGQLAFHQSSVWRYETPVDYQLVISTLNASLAADRRIYQYNAVYEVWEETVLSIPESYLVLSDNATGDVTTTKHGLCPKLPGDAIKVFCGDGLFKEIAGSAGVIKVYSKASANLRFSNTESRSTGETTPTKVKETKLNEPVQGVRVSFTLTSSYGTGPVYARIYRNGVAVGTQRSTSSAAGVTFTEDFNTLWSPNDLIQIYAWASSGEDAAVEAMDFLYDRAIAALGSWDIDTPADFIKTAQQTAYSMTNQDPT